MMMPVHAGVIGTSVRATDPLADELEDRAINTAREEVKKRCDKTFLRFRHKLQPAQWAVCQCEGECLHGTVQTAL